MTDRERGFLDAVLADTGDDFPRLVYADWLDDHGQPERAEFIRVQCRIAAVEAEVESGEDCESPSCPACSELRPLRRREGELLGCDVFPSWASAAVRGHVVTANYRRGFVASVSLTLVDFMAHAKAIFSAAPVEEVRLTDREPRSVREWETWVEWRHEGDPSEAELDRLRRENRVILGEPVYPRYVIPHKLFLAFAGRHDPHNDAYRRYRKPEIAHAALSLACVTYGRNLALSAKEAVSR